MLVPSGEIMSKVPKYKSVYSLCYLVCYLDVSLV
jgi:hypothetical protein